MIFSAFEPGQEMAIANFTLAICFIFTISIPLLLITRADKTESNREFIATAVNPWSQLAKKIEITPVVISEVTPTIEVQPKPAITSDINDEQVLQSEGVISLESKVPEDQQKSLMKGLTTNDEVLAA
tara:strand:+ start:6056 stop:6436 length:381 start_codon:yes stop_codon:yes gene_type:complete